MIHILREYLTSLKEEQELDSLIPIILASEGIVPVTQAQKGTRQFGVDVHGKKNNSDGSETHYLITIKRGDIDRRAWNENPQGVRASLEEIKDVYINNHFKNISSEKIVIVLCFGGVVKQNAFDNWSSYKQANSTDIVSFEEWGGETLARKIQDNLLGPEIFPEGIKKDFARALSFMEDLDYDLRHYKNLLNTILDKVDSTQKNFDKQVDKSFLEINLILNILHGFSKKDGNLIYSYKAAELALLYCWDKIKKDKPEAEDIYRESYLKLFQTYISISIDYLNKLSPYFHRENGLVYFSRNHLSSSIMVQQHVGIVSTIGLICYYNFIALNEKVLMDNAIACSDIICSIFDNHTVSESPCFDEHAIDITLALSLLCRTGRLSSVVKFLNRISRKMHFSYVLIKRLFPISSDSVDDIIELKKSPELFEDFTGTSTLIPIIAYFNSILGCVENYQFQLQIKKELEWMDLQSWYPAKGIKDKIFKGDNPSREGYGYAPLELPEDATTFPSILSLPLESFEALELEVDWTDTWAGLPIIASRHYRFPVIPNFYLDLMKVDFKKALDEALKVT